MRDHRFGGTLPGTGIGELGLRFGSALNGCLDLPGRLQTQRLERFRVVRQGRNGRVHGGDGITEIRPFEAKNEA